jgi:drug/metabolite transporter (DMT)-like permease
MGGVGLVAFAYAVFLALAFLPSLVVGSLIGAVTTSRKVAVLITTALAIGSAGWMLGIDKLNAVQAIALAISAGLLFPAITGLWLARRMKKRFRQPAWLPRQTT